mmetsp:Transcript_25432/g.73367  ORF Transcript_25432/g.73367 Transcript_25432/m.73367 type:complete len:353 (+) Transcript_25432:89-1147(+)
MPGRRVTLRPTAYANVYTSKAELEYGTAAEYVVHGLGILTNLLFVVGTICFFEVLPPEVYRGGIWCFIIASIMHLMISIFQSWESSSARWRSPGMIHSELAENILYCTAGVSYFVGSILWLPGLYSNPMRLLWGHATATWFFIWGSFALVVGSYWNAVGVIETNTLARTRIPIWVRRCASVALCCTAVGGSLFVAGSFLFRPGFKNSCEEPSIAAEVAGEKRLRHRRWQTEQTIMRPRRLRTTTPPPDQEMVSLCVDVIAQGTWLFLWGSVFFLAQSVLSLVCTMALHRTKPLPRTPIGVEKGPTAPPVAGMATAGTAIGEEKELPLPVLPEPSRTSASPEHEGALAAESKP